MEEVCFKSQKIRLRKTLIIAWIALIVLAIGFVTENILFYSRYKKWQDSALVIMCMINDVEPSEYEDRAAMCKDFYIDMTPVSSYIYAKDVTYDISEYATTKNNLINEIVALFEDTFDYRYKYMPEFVFRFVSFKDYVISRIVDTRYFPRAEYWWNSVYLYSFIVYFILLLITQIIHNVNRNAELMVKDNTLYYSKKSDKTLELPISRIQQIKRTAYKGIRIKSPGASFRISMLKNQVEMVDKITDTMRTVQNPANMQVATASSQLVELKELLDSGVITQEEFDAKKKQLLGV